MKYVINEYRSADRTSGYTVFGKRFPTRAEAVAFAEETVARRIAAAGRELSREELEQGIAKEDRTLRQRIAIVNQNPQGYGGTAPKPAAPTGPANANAVAWAEDALEKAKFIGSMSDVVAAKEDLARVQSGGEPIRPEHLYMLPGDKVSRMSDGEIRILRKSGEHDAVIHRWAAESAPDAIKSLTEKETSSV